MTARYMAPMEGLTDPVYRNAFAAYFGGVDKFFTPFLAPNEVKSFKTKEKREIAPENNKGLFVVPQLLTRNAEHFLWGAGEIADLGYREINLNLGCPSPTVVTKRKGSGFLGDTGELDRFLEEILPGLEKMGLRLSIKTRLGLADPEEFEKILAVYNRYPICELIVHPRVQKDLYRPPVRRKQYEYACEKSCCPVCYNGDLSTPDQVREVLAAYPETAAVMLGRGLIRTPWLAASLEEKSKESVCEEKLRGKLLRFHLEILEHYQELMSGDRPVLARVKEIGFHMYPIFTNYEKHAKKLKKTQRITEYRAEFEAFLGEETICSQWMF